MDLEQLLCDLCHERIRRFLIAADVELPDENVLAVELHYCIVCFKRQDLRVVRLKRAIDFSVTKDANASSS